MKTIKLSSFFFLLAFLIVNIQIARADDLNEISQHIKSTADEIAKGKTLFMANCSSCHGTEGKGDGPAAAAFNPKPRDFTAEKFKNGSSPSATFHTLTNGLGSMPAFSSLPVADRLALTHYLLSFSPYKASDAPEELAKIGLGTDYKPLAGFKGASTVELPVEFIIQRMASDGNVAKLDYKNLVKEQAAASPTPITNTVATTTPDAKRGEKLFTYCSTCHGNKAQGDSLAGAPQLAGQQDDYLIAQIKNFQTGVRGTHPNDVNGLKMRPMSRLLRGEQDILDVVAYINSLKPSKPANTLNGNASNGASQFATCIGCHGPQGTGVAAMKAPSLAHLQDWYMANQIHSFKNGYRGSDPRDVTGAQMRGMAAVVADDQAAADIAAYLQTLSKP